MFPKIVLEEETLRPQGTQSVTREDQRINMNRPVTNRAKRLKLEGHRLSEMHIGKRKV